VIPAFVLFLLCFAPHPVLGFPTGLNPVGFEGRIQYKHEESKLRRVVAFF